MAENPGQYIGVIGQIFEKDFSPNDFRKVVGKLDANLGQAIIDGQEFNREMNGMKFSTQRYSGNKQIEVAD